MPPNPPNKAHVFAMLRDMQISKSEKKILGPPCQILGTPLHRSKLQQVIYTNEIR